MLETAGSSPKIKGRRRREIRGKIFKAIETNFVSREVFIGQELKQFQLS